MKITATIQARVGSSRLPGKVLMPILGRPMLELQIERIRRSLLIDEIVIATSVKPQDDPLEKLAKINKDENQFTPDDWKNFEGEFIPF